MQARLRLFALACSAASCAVPPSDRARDVFAFTLDNDYFTGSDNNYSNGVALNYLSGPTSRAPEGSFTRRWAEAFQFLPWIDTEGDSVYVGFGVGQEIFTPDDIGDPNPPLTDQPYAGVLFVDFSFAGRGENQCTSWNFRLGTVGPDSYAREVQSEFHRLIDDEVPAGWETQLPNEPIFNVDYSVVYELELMGDEQLAARFVPSLGVSGGNYFTGASAAGYLEFGWNLPRTVGDISLRQGIDPIGLISASNIDGFSLSGFVGGGGFGVAHYLPLDGTLFRDSRSVDSEPLVGFLSTGATLRNGGLAITYQLSFFSERFETEVDNSDFGRVTLSCAF